MQGYVRITAAKLAKPMSCVSLGSCTVLYCPLTVVGQVGLLERRLQGYFRLQCLVMVTFQEGSKDLHALLETLADCKLRSLGLARRREGTERERSIFLSQLRRELSTVSAKAQSSCLLGRVARVGEGHRAAAKRREWVKRGCHDSTLEC